MKSLKTICTRLISEYLAETKLSASFFIDRIVPAALYFLPFIIIAGTGSSSQISAYAIFSSLFTSFVAIPLGFTSAVRYYSSLKEADEAFTPGSSLVLILTISLASIVLYCIYYYVSFFGNGYDRTDLLIIFALSILVTAPYYALSAYNEGKRNVRLNNLCGLISIPAFSAIVYTISQSTDLVTACAYAFLITRIMMLVIMLAGSPQKQRLLRSDSRDVFDMAKYGLSIASLFFIQKLVSTFLISLLSSNADQVSAFQLITVASMLLSLSSNAVFTNVFIKIVKKSDGAMNTFTISSFNIFLVLVFTLTAAHYAVSGPLGNVINDVPVLNIIKDNAAVILFYFTLDVLMTASFVISRAFGDTWRCQSVWCLGVVTGLVMTGFSPDTGSALKTFIFADVLSIFMCIFTTSRTFSLFAAQTENKQNG